MSHLSREGNGNSSTRKCRMGKGYVIVPNEGSHSNFHLFDQVWLHNKYLDICLCGCHVFHTPKHIFLVKNAVLKARRMVATACASSILGSQSWPHGYTNPQNDGSAGKCISGFKYGVNFRGVIHFNGWGIFIKKVMPGTGIIYYLPPRKFNNRVYRIPKIVKNISAQTSLVGYLNFEGVMVFSFGFDSNCKSWLKNVVFR